MSYTIHQSTTRRIYRGESGFHMIDGVKMVPRAEVVVLEQCPSNIRDMVNYAIAKGWIQPVANVRDDELVWEKLQS